jgi:hypothetical protein
MGWVRAMLLLDSVGCAMLNAAVSALDIGAGGAKLRSSIAGGSFVLFAMCALTLLVLLAGFGYHMYKDAGIEQQAINKAKIAAAAEALTTNFQMLTHLLPADSNRPSSALSSGQGKSLGSRSTSSITRSVQLGFAHATTGGTLEATSGVGLARRQLSANVDDSEAGRMQQTSARMIQRRASGRSMAFGALNASPPPLSPGTEDRASFRISVRRPGR